MIKETKMKVTKEDIMVYLLFIIMILPIVTIFAIFKVFPNKEDVEIVFDCFLGTIVLILTVFSVVLWKD